MGVSLLTGMLSITEIIINRKYEYPCQIYNLNPGGLVPLKKSNQLSYVHFVRLFFFLCAILINCPWEQICNVLKEWKMITSIWCTLFDIDTMVR